MGYTHYWTQKRSFTKDAWEETTDAVKAIVSYVENELGVPLADLEGTGGTRPEFTAATIMFNGLGDDSHETFVIGRKIDRVKRYVGHNPAWGFCKTARKPYDVAVTACLCYLSSVAETHSVTSDGNGPDFVLGLDAARKALPNKANILDIPLDIMRDDRWVGPWIDDHNAKYHAWFCVDGHGYVEHGDNKEWYRFETHADLAYFLNQNKYASFHNGRTLDWGGSYAAHEPNIWNATGSFDKARHARITRAQNKVLAMLFPVPAASAFAPPAFARPGDIVTDTKSFYSLDDMLKEFA